MGFGRIMRHGRIRGFGLCGSLVAWVALAAVLASCSGGGEQPPSSSGGPTISVAGTGTVPASTSVGSTSAAPASTGSPKTVASTSTSSVPPAAGGLVWTVIAVDQGDELNVRGEPDPSSEIVATLLPWSVDLDVGADVESNSSGTWRQIQIGGAAGWVNARFLVAQPEDLSAEDLNALSEMTSDLVEELIHGSRSPSSELFAEDALWLGGNAIFAEGHGGWEWIPRRELADRSGWEAVRAFRFAGEDCGTPCHKSVLEYLDLPTDYELAVDDIAPINQHYSDGELAWAPTLHRVVLASPGDTNNWVRSHFVFDWADGEPKLKLIQRWGWSP